MNLRRFAGVGGEADREASLKGHGFSRAVRPVRL